MVLGRLLLHGAPRPPHGAPPLQQPAVGRHRLIHLPQLQNGTHICFMTSLPPQGLEWIDDSETHSKTHIMIMMIPAYL